MARRKKDEAVAESQSEKVVAIFDPPGEFRLRVLAPSGKFYEIASRSEFEIESEDVEWFFTGWQREHRQHLSRASEYKPRQPQFNNGMEQLDAGQDVPTRSQFDNGAAQLAASEEEEQRPVASPEPEPAEDEPVIDEPQTTTTDAEPLSNEPLDIGDDIEPTGDEPLVPNDEVEAAEENEE